MKKKYIKFIAVIFYGSILTIVISIVHTWHFIDLRASSNLDLKTALLKEHSKGEYKLLHVLGTGCGCSEFTAEYLFNRGAKKEIREIVYFLGRKNELKYDLLSKGYEVFYTTIKQLTAEKKEIGGVPLFQIYSKGSNLLYSGGYSSSMITRGSKYQDLLTLKKVVRDGYAKANPILGCAVGKKFMNLIDPIGLKYE